MPSSVEPLYAAGTARVTSPKADPIPQVHTQTDKTLVVGMAHQLKKANRPDCRPSELAS